jgi:hypothetical protein
MSLTSYRAAPPCVTFSSGLRFCVREIVWLLEDGLFCTGWIVLLFDLEPAGLAAAYFPEA